MNSEKRSAEYGAEPFSDDPTTTTKKDSHAQGQLTDDDRVDAEERNAVVRIHREDVKPLSEQRRFTMLTVACFAMICGSTSYAYNLISRDIQVRYGFSFREMSSINTVGMCFCYFLLPYGFIFDYLGPKPLYVLGCILFPLGALLFGLTFQGVIEGSAVKFAVFNALLSLGSQLFDLASVVVMLSVFPTRRGWVVALLKTIMGLGQAVIGCIKEGFFSTSTQGYFYFLLGLVIVIGAGALFFLELPPYHLTHLEERRLSKEKQAERLRTKASYLVQDPPMWRFYFGIAILVILIVYLPTTSAIAAFLKKEKNLGVANYRRPVAIVAIIITLFMLGIMMPFPWLDRLTSKKAKPADGDADEEDAVVLEAATDIDFIAPQYQTTFWQSCCTLKLWCILFTMFAGVGSEFVIIFNASYLYSALAKVDISTDNTVATLLTVINGCGSAVGRLLMSAFEIWSQGKRAEDRVPITISFFVSTVCIIVAIVLFLVLPGRSLLVAYSVASLGNGFCASVTILVLRTIYAKDPAKHYNFGYNALWISGVLLNRLLFGEWYSHMNSKPEKRKLAGKSPYCMGRDCVMMPLLVMLGLNCIAFISNVYLHIRYVLFSRKVLAERRRIKQDAEAEKKRNPPTDTANDDAYYDDAGKQVYTAEADAAVLEDSMSDDRNETGARNKRE